MKHGIVKALFVLAGILPITSSALGAVTEFGQINIGSATTATVAIPLTTTQYSAGPVFAMHYGVDFSVGACSATVSGCNLTVSFSPQSPGSRADAVGPLGSFSPGTLRRRSQ